MKQAFEWLSKELDLPDDINGQVFRTVLLSLQQGDSRAVQKLQAAWPKEARWASGEAYLRTLGWRSPDEFASDEEWDVYVDEYDGPELMELLYERLLHVGHRLFRDEQVRDMLVPAIGQRSPAYTHALLNRDGDFRGDPCGLGIDKIISVEEALTLMEQPAHDHPACCCTVDPFPVTSADRTRLKAVRGGQ